ncbi:MAG TPA: hypothetical protein VK663_04135 [Burkholderiales bacterium]|nr:hypothetical protein [Burkholderiales bacterium]
MLNLTGTQKITDTLSLLRDTHDVIAELPAGDAVAAVAQITDALAAINGADTLTLEERYDDIHLLDAATVDRTRLLLREYLDTSRQMKQREAEIWNRAYHCWRELATAYSTCVQRYASDAAAVSAFHKPARVAVARAIRASRRQLQWLRIRYAPPVPAIWTSLADLYAYIEPENIEEEMLIYPGETTTIRHEFLKVLIQSALTCENLQPREQDLLTFIVGRYASSFVLAKSALAGCTHWFDLKHPAAPAPIASVPQPGSDLRYFGPGAALASLEQALRTLEQTGLVPAEFGFKYPIEPAFLTPVLTQIYQDWTGQTPSRQHVRQNTNARITVVPGFRETLDVLVQSIADPFDFTQKAEVESWVANDISDGGFGAVIPAVSGDWVGVGSVAGIESDVGGEWCVGVVRRLQRLADGQQQIGMQVLSRNAQAVRFMREDSGETKMRITQRMLLDHAILLTADAARQKEIELLVNDIAGHDAGNMHMVVGDSVLIVQFKAVLEKMAVCTHVCFTVLGIES